MLILGIETSGTRGSVALCSGEELLHSFHFPDGYRHSRDIMTAVDSVVRQAGAAKGDVGAVAVSEGPGSFTGLRVGVTCAKTLAYVLGWQAVGVPSLEVLVQNVDPHEHACRVACPLRDARRTFVYGTVFRWEEGRWNDLTGVMAGRPEEVAARIPRPALVFGSGAEAYPEAFPCGPQAGLLRGPQSLAEGRAEHVARVGLRILSEGGAVPPMELTARYYRVTEAEEKVGQTVTAPAAAGSMPTQGGE